MTRLSNPGHSDFPDPSVPTIPVIAADVLCLVREKSQDIDPLTQIVHWDPALSLRVLRAANLPHFTSTGPCTTVPQAIARLGYDAAMGIALGFALAERITPEHETAWEVGLDYADFWQRALRYAAAARAVATITGACDPEEAFCTAIIQDVGMMTLYPMHGDTYLQAIDLADDNHAKLVEIEQRSFGTDHQQIGAALLERWNFPDIIVEAVRCHHAADHAKTEARPLARCVDLAGRIASSIESTSPTDIASLPSQWFGCDAQTTNMLITSCLLAAAEAASMVNVNDADAQRSRRQLLAEAEQARLEHEIALMRLTDQGCDTTDHSADSTTDAAEMKNRTRAAA